MDIEKEYADLNVYQEFKNFEWGYSPETSLELDTDGRISITGKIKNDIFGTAISVMRVNPQKKIPWPIGVMKNSSLFIECDIDSWENMPIRFDRSSDSIRTVLSFTRKTPVGLGNLFTKGYDILKLASTSSIVSLKGMCDSCSEVNITGSSKIKDLQGISSKIDVIYGERSALVSLKGIENIEKRNKKIKLYLQRSDIRSLEYCPKNVKVLDLSECKDLVSLRGIPISGKVHPPQHLSEQYERFKSLQIYTGRTIREEKNWIESAINTNIDNMDLFFEIDLPESYKVNLDAYKGAIEWGG